MSDADDIWGHLSATERAEVIHAKQAEMELKEFPDLYPCTIIKDDIADDWVAFNCDADDAWDEEERGPHGRGGSPNEALINLVEKLNEPKC